MKTLAKKTKMTKNLPTLDRRIRPDEPQPLQNTLPNQIMKQESQDDEERSQWTPQDPTQGTMAPPKEHGASFSLPQLPRPSQAETVDLSQSLTPRHQSTRDIVFESPTRPIFSSTPVALPTPARKGECRTGFAYPLFNVLVAAFDEEPNATGESVK